MALRPHKPLATISLLLITSLVLTGLLIPVSVTVANSFGSENTACDISAEQGVITSPLLSVLTLNLAHGRKDAFNQMLQRTSTTRRNLEEIAEFLGNSGADLVALQEADAPSRWSGKFNHVEYVSEKSAYPCWLHTRHAQKYMYDFGTALLSRVPYTNSLLHTFEPSPPTTNKGFVMGEVLWNPDGELPQPIAVSVISVHLDFSRKKVRQAQTEEMRGILPDITTPVIIMGDFNTEWDDEDSALKAIAAKGNFKVYQPEAPGLGTYKSGKHRLDWILISNDLEFVSYEVPQVNLSDHQPVKATLKLIDISDEEKDSSQ